MRIAREGWVFGIVTLGVGVAAINTGNNLLYLVLGFLLSLILVSGVLSELALRGLVVSRRLPRRCFAGQPCMVELTIRNGKVRLPSFSLEADDLAADPSDRRCYFLKIAPSSEQTASYRRTPLRRGRLRFHAVRVATRYPFGLIEKYRVFAVDDQLVVYPALAHVSERDFTLPDVGAESRAGIAGPGFDPLGLREYRPGDPAKAIHWRRSARHGRLIIREREAQARAKVRLGVDNRDDLPDDELERRISETAALAALALKRGAAVQVRAIASHSPVLAPHSQPDPIFRFLAELATVPAATDGDRLPGSSRAGATRGAARSSDSLASQEEPT